ncbi:Uu.00g063780.m01.CDS01 [Anthostomella pinea]|uniref:Uu.00g063780.m01.CDS01 n=1 Tax=Anthostomella pinea TaxID=933095 RepID=A0AAI8VUN8_9PEZI|nr:Uu.00g063780.m01.CDS01 [Anthostomella pinea]
MPPTKDMPITTPQRRATLGEDLKIEAPKTGENEVDFSKARTTRPPSEEDEDKEAKESK